MNTDLIVQKIDEGRRALAEARTIPQAKAVADVAAAAETYARRQKLGAEAEAYARELRLDAERLLGQMLQQTPKNVGAAAGGEKQSSRGTYVEPRDRTPTLADLGIDKKTSARAQQIAGLKPAEFEQIKSGGKSLMQVQRDVRAERIRKEVSAPTAKYRVIYADPPWSYGNNQPDYHTEQRDHYPVMSLRAICDLPVADWTEPNAVLFLWVTSPILEESFQVINAWGFKYKSSFVWDKIKHNMGHYNSVRHELLLVCTRGSGVPDVPKLFDSVVSIERTEHSAKPGVFRKMIETLYPNGKRLEIFARESVAGWDAYGFEAQNRAA